MCEKQCSRIMQTWFESHMGYQHKEFRVRRCAHTLGGSLCYSFKTPILPNGMYLYRRINDSKQQHTSMKEIPKLHTSEWIPYCSPEILSGCKKAGGNLWAVESYPWQHTLNVSSTWGTPIICMAFTHSKTISHVCIYVFQRQQRILHAVPMEKPLPLFHWSRNWRLQETS